MSRRAVVIPMLLALAAAGTVVILFTTRHGVGVTPDSVNYFFAAEEFRAGRGLSQFSAVTGDVAPLTHWPPLYPLTLAAAGAFGAHIPDAARGLNLLLFGANIALAGWVVYRYSGSAAASFASFLMLASTAMIDVHSVAWTEPLFILFALLTLHLLARAVERPGWALLIVSAVSCSLAFVTRYAGVALAAAGIAGVLLIGAESAGRRVRRALIFAAVACLPMAAWLMWTAATSSGAPRSLVFHPASRGELARALDVLALWVLPETLPTAIRVAVAAAAAVAVALGLWRVVRFRKLESEPNAGALSRLLIAFIASYAATLALTRLLFDAQTVCDSRMLSPLWPPMAMLAALVGHAVYRDSAARRWVRGIVLAAGVLVAAGAAWRGAVSVHNLYVDSAGYASQAWAQSDLMRRVRELPPDATVYSNGPDAIYFLTGRSSRYVPLELHPNSTLPDAGLEARLARMSDDLLQRGALIVCSRQIEPYRGYLLSEREMKERLPLDAVFECADGAIYRLKPAPASPSR